MKSEGRVKRKASGPVALPAASVAFMLEAGCDEAGRGCLAGPVCAAAVILPDGYSNPLINDSKKLSERRRAELRDVIERDALAWAVALVDNREIDEINILNASILAMHKALDSLEIRPGHIVVDGNRFKPYGDTPYLTVVKGDATYGNIAAASILAKTHRDELMQRLAAEYPGYNWEVNKGYPTADHLEALRRLGPTPYHRLTFRGVRQE